MILYEKIIIKSAEFAICKNILHSLRLIMIMITGILISIILFNNFIEICQTVLCAFILQNTYRTYKTIGKTQNCASDDYDFFFFFFFSNFCVNIFLG